MQIRNLLIALGIIFIGLVIYQLINAQLVEKDLKEVGLELTGIITDKKELRYGHDFGYVRIDVHNSNYSDYDPRRKDETYFFIIRRSRCALLIPGISQVEIGDSIAVKVDKFSIFRNNKTIKENSNLTIIPSLLLDDLDTLLTKD